MIESIDDLIQVLKTGSEGERLEAGKVPLLQDADPWVRGKTATALGNMGNSPTSAVPSLIPLLDDPDEHVLGSMAPILICLKILP